MLLYFFLSTANFEPQVDKAKAYVLEQDLLSGYIAFSKSLDELPLKNNERLSLTENEIFDELYALYLLDDGQGKQLEDAVLKAVSDHPEFKSLLFFKAALLANSGATCAFFDTFKSVYVLYPEHPLAFKIRGSIAHRIFELSPDLEKRDEWRAVSINFFLKSFALKPEDVSLISRVVLLSRPDEQKMLFSKLLPALSMVEKPPARRQCWVLLEIASQNASKDDLKELSGLMRKWFPQSRFLDEWERRNT